MLKNKTDALVVAHQLEAEWLLDPDLNGSAKTNTPIISEWPDILLIGDEWIQCGSLNIRAIHSPGHSPGSTCFLINEAYLFTGDTLLAGVVWPTNLPFGDRELLKEFIKNKLFSLPGDFIIYRGYGETTTLETGKTFTLQRWNKPSLNTLW